MCLQVIHKQWDRPGKPNSCGTGYAIMRVPQPRSAWTDGVLLHWFAGGGLVFGQWSNSFCDGFLKDFTGIDYPYGFHLLPDAHAAYEWWHYYRNTTQPYARHDWVLAKLEWRGLLARGEEMLCKQPFRYYDVWMRRIKTIVVNRVCLLGVVSDADGCLEF